MNEKGGKKMDITELMKEKEKIDSTNYRNKRKLAELISQSTFNLVNTRILTPIFLKDNNRWRVEIDQEGIKKWKSSIVPRSEKILNRIEVNEYQSIAWAELADWIKNQTELDPNISNIFYQIGETVRKYNFKPVVIYLGHIEIIRNGVILDNKETLWGKNLIKQKEILPQNTWDLILSVISKYNKKLEKKNKFNQQVIENLKNELS